MVIKPKLIKCKTCTIDCYSGKRGLCLKCHKKEEILKAKNKVKAEKIKVKKEEKKFNKSTLMSVADTVFSLYIRLNGTDELGFGKCCSSGKIVAWGSIDNGHYIPRGYMKYRYDERNCHVQSKNDNGRLHGNIPEYRRFIINTYGESVEQEMFTKSKDYFKPENDFFLNIIQSYLPKVKILLQTKSFDVTNYWNNIIRFEKTYLK